MKSPHMYSVETEKIEGIHVNDLTRLMRQGLKRGLAVVLFTLLLVGGAGAVISAFAAGVTALSNVHASWEYPSSTPSVATMGPSSTESSANGSASTYGSSNSVAKGAPTSAPLSPESTRTGNSSNSQGADGTVDPLSSGSQTSAASKQSSVDRFNQELSQMQSPVMQHLDAGGVSLGNQVQNAFGSFLSGLLQTLFVEQPDQGGSAGTPSEGGGQ